MNHPRLAAHVALLLCLVVALGGRGVTRQRDGDERDRAPAATSRPRSLVGSTTSTSAPERSASVDLPPAVPELLALLPDPGAGWTEVRSGRGVGSLDLARAAEAEADVDAERSLLETRRFEAGHGRAWSDDAGRRLYAAVYRFPDPASAAAYQLDGLEQVLARGATEVTVEGVPGGRAFSLVRESSKGSTVTTAVTFTKGRDFFLVFASGPTASGLLPLARDLATAITSG